MQSKQTTSISELYFLLQRRSTKRKNTLILIKKFADLFFL